MNTATTSQPNSRQRITAMLTYLFICTLYAAVFIYAAYMLYAGAEKLNTYFNSCIAAVDDQLNYSLR